MKFFGRSLAMVVIACLAVFGTIQNSSAENTIKLPQAIKAKGQITIGINAIFAPMEFKNPGSDKLIGFDVDFAKALGKAMGVKVVFNDMAFDALLPSVTTGRVDCVISALSDTAARRPSYDFIDYFISGTQVFTTKAYAKNIKTLQDLSGKTLAVSASTDYRTTMQKWSKDNLEAKGKPGIKILPVDSEATARLQMVQGRAQASAISPEVLGWLSRKNSGQFVPVGPILAPDPYGICFKKGNTELLDAVYEAFKRVIKDGTYQKLLAKWDVTHSGVTEPLINGRKK